MILIADSGSTKTDWCLAQDGKALCRFSTPGINPVLQSEEEIESHVRGQVIPALAECQKSAGGRERGGVESVRFYGSGCREDKVAGMEQLLRRCFAVADVEVCSDLVGAARALSDGEEVIACILGTGSNSCLFDGQKIVCNVSPMGYVLGDEGSGAVLGRLLVNALFKAGWPAALQQEMRAAAGLTLDGVIQRVYREPMPNRFLASLAPVVHRFLGYREVEELVVENFRSFFRRNVSAYGRPDLPVGAVGSIAWFFRGQLEQAAKAEGYEMGRILQGPMDRLVEKSL